ncbi:MAG TPA: nucleotidyltransferase family protein [Lysobacter sp.]|jgi:molybdenum cofactor cytidylyltransferase|nr:nucleotidyltransferase family protein [Lysobacter sp.]
MRGHHVAVVLAAGGSRRLGRCKQLLTRGGETLVHRAVRLAGETAPLRLVVVVGTQNDAVTKAIAGLDAELLTNPHWSAGLSSSLQCAAHALRGHVGSVLILGCDQPALEADHLRQLLAGAGGAVSECAATVHGTRLGTPAVITSDLLRVAQQLGGEQGFGNHLSGLQPDAVWRLSAPELQLDIDSAQDEQAAISRGLLDRADVRL